MPAQNGADYVLNLLMGVIARSPAFPGRAEKTLILIRGPTSNFRLFDHLPEEVRVRPLNNWSGDATEVPRRRLGLGEGSLDESYLRKGFRFPQHLMFSLVSASTQRDKLRPKFINGGQCSFPGLPRPGGKTLILIRCSVIGQPTQIEGRETKGRKDRERERER